MIGLCILKGASSALAGRRTGLSGRFKCSSEVDAYIMRSQSTKPFKLTAPKPYIPKEYDEQCSVFEEAAIRAKQDSRWALLFSTLNGVRLPMSLAVKMKKAGNRPGVPDIILPVPRVHLLEMNPYGPTTYYGLFIEMKRQKGAYKKPEPDQLWWHQQLSELGYRVEVAKGAKQAIAIITAYLED
jgi:hypothetical protein